MLSWSLKLPFAYGVPSAPSITAQQLACGSATRARTEIAKGHVRRTGLNLVKVLLLCPGTDARWRVLVQHLEFLLQPHQPDVRRHRSWRVRPARARGGSSRGVNAVLRLGIRRKVNSLSTVVVLFLPVHTSSPSAFNLATCIPFAFHLGASWVPRPWNPAGPGWRQDGRVPRPGPAGFATGGRSESGARGINLLARQD